VNYSNLFRLDDRKSFVLGAGSGIGRESSLALAAHGAHVICADRDLDAAKHTAKLIANEGGHAQAYELDVLDTDAVFAAAADHPDVETLLFTAATNVRKRLLDYSSEEYDRVVNLNVRSSFDLIRAFGANMVRQQKGSIIGFSSVRHLVVEPGQGVYAATKAATVQLLRTAAAEFGPAGVRANAVAPGCVDTPLTDSIKANPEWYNAYATKGALGRWSQPSELTGAVVYLASDASSYVTGTVLYVDGGWTAVDGRFDPPTS
jgi:NAD(P)-dependent dehydrogenase (short-subunit alcohol dehydrogenase family)